MLDVKIFVACHDEFNVPKSEYLYPIQVGTVFSDKRIPGFIHDDEGDNISYKNKSYCELTALYWAYKNADADYYGLFHYRRYLSFNPAHEKNNGYYRTYDMLDDNAYMDLMLDPENISEIVKDYDVIAPIANNIQANFKNNYEQYCNSNYLHKEDMDVFIEVIKEKYPYLSKYVDAYMNSHFAYFCNVSIMKKEYFMQYCEMLFDILEETEKRCDVSEYSVNDLRVFGHLSERFFGIMFNYWLADKDVRTKKLRMATFTRNEKLYLSKAFDRKNIAIALSSNNYYSYYLGVTIQSIVDNSDDKYNYDIIVMDGGILASNKNLILSQVKGHSNISVRFYSSKNLQNHSSLGTKMHMSVETWYRLYLPFILPDYEKIIYIDCDLVVNSNLADLYYTKLGDSLCAATIDLPLVGLYSDNHFVEYFNNELGLKNPKQYLQAGVLLLNLRMFREKYTLDELLELATSKDWRWLDQDVMNVLANDTLKILPQNWNVEVNREGKRMTEIKFCSAELFFNYMKARENPYIVHYSGGQKPWASPEMDMAEYFWKYARQSAFYELILYRIMNSKSEAVTNAVYKVVDRRFNTVVPRINSLNEKVERQNTEARMKFRKLLPKGSARRLAVRRMAHLFKKDVYPTEKGYWTIESDIHMHNDIMMNKVKKSLGLSFTDQYMKQMHKFKNIHKGERCFITCTGPSLMISDLERLSNEYTFGVNSIVRAYEKTDWRPTYYCLVDLYAFGEYLKNNEVPGNNLAIENAFLHYRTQLASPVGNELYVPISYRNHTEKNMKKGSIKLSSDPAVCIYDCFTVTNMAIQMAIYMGFKDIYIIGADCSYTPDKMHFMETKGIDDKQRNARYLPEAVRLSIKGYEAAYEFAKRKGVNIYNATRGGMLEVFPRVDFDTIDLK